MEITKEEARDIIDFIDNSLDSAWDRYTDLYVVTGVSREEGKQRMNPAMYELMQNLQQKLWGEQ